MSESVHINGDEKRRAGFSNAWGFAVVSALTTILLIGFGIGFLLLPEFQHGHMTSISGAARHALGFESHEHNHTAIRLGAAAANEIPTQIVWNEATIHAALNGNAARGESIAVDCAACHGEKGVSQQGWIPTLAGINSIVIYKQLADFRSQTRLSGPMSAIAQCLSEQDSADLGAYFSALPGVQHNQSVRAPKFGTSYRAKDPIQRLIFAGDSTRGIRLRNMSRTGELPSGCAGTEWTERGISRRAIDELCARLPQERYEHAHENNRRPVEFTGDPRTG